MSEKESLILGALAAVVIKATGRRPGRITQLCFAGLLAAASMAPTTGSAQEFVRAAGALSDTDFYRAVSCGATPGGSCRKPVVRWPRSVARDVTVSVSRADPAFSAAAISAYLDALRSAVAEINAANAGVQLRLTRGKADIQVLLLDMEPNGVVTGSGVPGLDGVRISAAWVHLWWNGKQEIQRGAIVFTPALHGQTLRSTVLEELFQATGLLTDVSGPWYTDRSILSQDGHKRTTLGGQDIMALRRHYP